MPKKTSTSSFGVTKREGHDSSGFYARRTPGLAQSGGSFAINCIAASSRHRGRPGIPRPRALAQ